MNDAQTCMGGWCRIRESCTRYHGRTGIDPAERLCEQGADGVCLDYRVVLVRKVPGHAVPVVTMLPEAA
jgi:hypothetical protein